MPKLVFAIRTLLPAWGAGGMPSFGTGSQSKPLPPASPPSSRTDASSGSVDKLREKSNLFLQGLVEVLPPEVSFGRRSVCIATVRTVELVHAGS